MRVNFYNARHDLVLGLKKVKSILVHADRSVHVVIKTDTGEEVLMPIKSTDYDHIEALGR